MTVHECPRCDCDECEWCGTHIRGEPYRTTIEWFKSAKPYTKQKTPGRKERELDLCQSCAGDLRKIAVSEAVERGDDDA